MAEEGVGQEKAAVPIFSRRSPRDHTSRQKYDCCAETSWSCQEPVHLAIDMYTLVEAAGDMRAVVVEEEEEDFAAVQSNRQALIYSISRKGKRSAHSPSRHTVT